MLTKQKRCSFQRSGIVAKIDLFGIFLGVNSIQYGTYQKWKYGYYRDVLVFLLKYNLEEVSNSFVP